MRNFEDLGVRWPSNVHLYAVKRLNMTAAIRPDWSLWIKVTNFEVLDARWPSNVHLYEVKRLYIMLLYSIYFTILVTMAENDEFRENRRHLCVKRSFPHRNTS